MNLFEKYLSEDIIYKITSIIIDDNLFILKNLMLTNKYFNISIKLYIENILSNDLICKDLAEKKSFIPMNIDLKYYKTYSDLYYDGCYYLYYISQIKPNSIINFKNFNNFKNYWCHNEIIAEKAIEKSGINIALFDKSIRNNVKLAFKAIEQNKYAEIHVGEIKYKSIELIKFIARKNPEVIKYNKTFAVLLSFVYEILEYDGLLIKYSNDAIKGNLRFAKKAVKNNYKAYYYLTKEIKTNVNNMISLYNTNNKILEIDEVYEFLKDYISI